MCQRQAPLRHHLYQVAQAQFEAKVPAHAQNDDLAVEMSAREPLPTSPGSGRHHSRRASVVCTRALLSAWQAINSQVGVLSWRLIGIARADQTVKRLMTAPGVGVLVALTYASVIDEPQRFAKSSSVGA
jgi:hypothetical protein